MFRAPILLQTIKHGRGRHISRLKTITPEHHSQTETLSGQENYRPASRPRTDVNTLKILATRTQNTALTKLDQLFEGEEGTAYKDYCN